MLRKLRKIVTNSKQMGVVLMVEEIKPTKVNADVKRYTQTQLADMTGMSVASVSRFLSRNKKNLPKPHHRGRAKLYDASVLHQLQQYRDQQVDSASTGVPAIKTHEYNMQIKEMKHQNELMQTKLNDKDELIKQLQASNKQMKELIDTLSDNINKSNEIAQSRLDFEKEQAKTMKEIHNDDSQKSWFGRLFK